MATGYESFHCLETAKGYESFDCIETCLWQLIFLVLKGVNLASVLNAPICRPYFNFWH